MLQNVKDLTINGEFVPKFPPRPDGVEVCLFAWLKLCDVSERTFQRTLKGLHPKAKVRLVAFNQQ